MLCAPNHSQNSQRWYFFESWPSHYLDVLTENEYSDIKSVDEDAFIDYFGAELDQFLPIDFDKWYTIQTVFGALEGFPSIFEALYNYPENTQNIAVDQMFRELLDNMYFEVNIDMEQTIPHLIETLHENIGTEYTISKISNKHSYVNQLFDNFQNCVFAIKTKERSIIMCIDVMET